MDNEYPPPTPDGDAVGRRAGSGRSPLLVASELQDHLLIATNDLDRLQRLLGDAGGALMTHFHAAATQLKSLRRELQARPDVSSQNLEVAMNHLASAITSLQFQDMASQLITHTGQRLRGCADRLAADAMEMDDEGDTQAFLDTIPLRPNPVTQDEMDAGSVELF
jgi:hypothetical protein